MLTFSLDEVRLLQRLYEAPTETLWRAEVRNRLVTVLKMRRSEEESEAGLRVHAEISANPSLKEYFVEYLGAATNQPKTVLYESLTCQLSVYIERHRGSLRDKDWFYREGLPVLKLLTLSVRLLHRNKLLHGNITLSSIFLTDTRILKLGDFRLAKKVSGTRKNPRYLEDMQGLCSVLLYYVCNSTPAYGPPPGAQESQQLLRCIHPRLFETIVEGVHLSAKELGERLNTLNDTGTLRQVQQPMVSLPSIRAESLLSGLVTQANSANLNESRVREIARQFIALRGQLSQQKLSIRFA